MAQRWFASILPASGVSCATSPTVDGLFHLRTEIAANPGATDRTTDVSHEGFPFLACARWTSEPHEAVVGRLSLTGELGYEVTVPTSEHRGLLRELRDAGGDDGLRLIGDRAIDSLRLEKGYGIWSAEFTPGLHPGHVRPRSFRRVRQGRVCRP